MGCGRVGSAVALELRNAGWDVSVVDEREEALVRLGDDWTGEFLVGHGMDLPLLREAGIEDADAVVVATDGDNSNIVIGQMAQKQFGVGTVVVRILDPRASGVLQLARPQRRLPDGERDRDASPTPCAPPKGCCARCSCSSQAAARSARTSRGR